MDLEPIDPRDAFTVTPEPVDGDARLVAPTTLSEATESAAASQAALLLSARAGVLGVGDEFEAEAQEASDAGFEIPDLRPLQRSRRLRVDEATVPLGMSVKELGQ